MLTSFKVIPLTSWFFVSKHLCNYLLYESEVTLPPWIKPYPLTHDHSTLFRVALCHQQALTDLRTDKVTYTRPAVTKDGIWTTLIPDLPSSLPPNMLLSHIPFLILWHHHIHQFLWKERSPKSPKYLWIMRYLLYVRSFSKHFTCICPFNPFNNPIG